MYEFAKLNLSALDAYASLIDPECHPENISNLLAFGAIQDGKPIGLILVQLIQVLQTGDILYLFVAEKHRGDQIEKQLLSLVQQELTKQNFILLLFSYPGNKPESAHLEQAFKTLGWPPTRLLIIHCRFDGYQFNPPWLKRGFHFSKGVREFSWDKLKPSERAELMKQEKNQIFPTYVSPFKNSPFPIEKINSLGLRHKGEVIGWMITQRIDPDTIRYSALYIQKSWQTTGSALKLLKDSIMKQIKSGVKWGVLDVNLDQTERSWLHFLERRLMPYAQEVTYTRQAWCDLGV